MKRERTKKKIKKKKKIEMNNERVHSRARVSDKNASFLHLCSSQCPFQEIS